MVGKRSITRRASSRIDAFTSIPFNPRDFLCDPEGSGRAGAGIVAMHHLVALGGSVLQGCLNLREPAAAEYNGRFRRSVVVSMLTL
jgi:hypothetical protein